MTAHKHAEMIKAKADNVELVVFCNNGGKWFEYGQRGDYCPFYEEKLKTRTEWLAIFAVSNVVGWGLAITALAGVMG